MFNTLYKLLLNILFPQSKIEKEISALSPESLSDMLHIEDEGGVVSLFQYKNEIVRHMVWLLKYKGNKYVAKLFAAVLYDYLIEELSDDVVFDRGTSHVVIPLPLSRKRKRERGFNQMEFVTHELEKLGDISINTNILVRKKHMEPQTSLSNKAERKRNVKGVFSVQDVKINLKKTHVILIDDVFTTGSTLQEAKRALKEVGARRVSSIALAH